MRIDQNLQEKAVLAELSKRIRQYRVDYPLTREELAEISMVSVGTIARFENGSDIGLSNLIKLLKALGLENNLDLLAPDPEERPSNYIRSRTQRQRARKAEQVTTDWKWGDEK